MKTTATLTAAEQIEAERLVRRLLELYGDDPMRDGLLETPRRVVKSWAELYGGYRKEPADVVKVFDCDNDQMVVLKDIGFYSNCEHHDLPFFGTVHVGYLPAGKVIGASKPARLVDVFARRLQLQERLTQEIADALDLLVRPLGVGVVVEARHLCGCARGVRQPGMKMVTSRMTGLFRDKPEVRAEFLALAGLK